MTSATLIFRWPTPATRIVQSAASSRIAGSEMRATSTAPISAPTLAAVSAAIRPVIPTRPCSDGAARVWRSLISSVMNSSAENSSTE